MEKTPNKAIFSYKLRVDWANNGNSVLSIVRFEDYKNSDGFPSNDKHESGIRVSGSHEGYGDVLEKGNVIPKKQGVIEIIINMIDNTITYKEFGTNTMYLKVKNDKIDMGKWVL